jgi:hypothetical protein
MRYSRNWASDTAGLPWGSDICLWPLQNSFWITEDKFSGLWARQSKNRVGDHNN